MSESAPVGTTSRPNPHPFAYSFGVAGAAVVVLLIILLSAFGTPSGHGLGYALGRLALPFAVGALVAALIARGSAKEWTWLRYASVVVPIGLLLSLLASAG